MGESDSIDLGHSVEVLAQVSSQHEGVAARLINETYAIEDRASSAGKDGEIGGDHALIDTARYTHPRPRPPFRPPPSINLPQAIDAPSSHSVRVPAPWDLERRRSSASDIHDPPSSSWPLESSTSAAFAPNDSSHRRRPRSPSTVSTSSVSSSSSSLSASSASISPRRHTVTQRHLPHQNHHHSIELGHPRHHERRHSSHEPLSSQVTSTLRNASIHPPSGDFFPPQPRPIRPAGSNSRGLNVRWEDDHGAIDAIRRPIPNQNQVPMPIKEDPRRMSDETVDRRRRAGNGSGGRSASPLRGVGRRRHDTVGWN